MTLASHVTKDVRLMARDWRALAMAAALPPLILLSFSRLGLAGLGRTGSDPEALILVLCVAFPSLLAAGGALQGERRDGTLRRLRRTPASLAQVVVSKSIAGGILVVVQSAATLLVVPLTLSGRVTDQIADVAILLVLTGIASYALGLVISAAARSEGQATQLTAIAFLLMLTLSGFLRPLDQVGLVGDLAAYAPVALGYRGVHGVLAGTSEVWVLGALVAVDLALSIVAVGIALTHRNGR